MGKIRKDSSITTIIGFIGLGIGYINKAVLFPTFLLQEQIGLVALIISLSTLFAQLANLGTSNTIIRFFPFIRAERRRLFFAWNLSIVITGLIGVVAFTWLFQADIYAFYDGESGMFKEYAYWIYFLGAANLFFTFFENFLKAVFQVILPVMLQEFYLRIAVTVTILLYAFGGISFDTFLILHLSAYLLPFFALLIKVLFNREIVGYGKRMNIPSRMKKLMLRYSTLTYLNTLGSTFVFMLDTIMLAGMSDLAETGNYSTALFISSVLMIPYRAIYRVASAFVPTYWKSKETDKMNELYKQVSSINLVFMLYLILAIGWNIREFFSLLPPEYASGVLIFFVLAIGRAFDAYGGINGYILITSRFYYMDIYFTFALIASAIGLNYLLIPLYNGMGAAWATTIVVAVYNLLRIFYLLRKYGLSPFEWSNLKVIALAAVISLPLLFFSFSNLPVIIAILVKGIYITLTFGFFVLYLRIEPQLNDYFDKILAHFIKR